VVIKRHPLSFSARQLADSLVRPLAFLLIASLLLIGCGDGSASSDDAAPLHYPEPKQPTFTVAGAPQREVNKLAFGVNAFGVELHKQLAADSGADQRNLCFSPYGVHGSLAMLIMATQDQQNKRPKDETRKQLEAAMHLTMMNTELRGTSSTLLNQLYRQGKSNGAAQGGGAYRIYVANAIWAKQGVEYDKAYLDHIRQFWASSFHVADFVDHRDDAELEMNQLIAKQTGGRVRDGVLSEKVRSDSELIVTNALQLQADWNVPFVVTGAGSISFEQVDGARVDVPTMVGRGEFEYVETDAYQLMKVPTKNKQLAMLLWLPKAEGNGLRGLEESMSFERMLEVMRKMKPTKMKVELPRFAGRSRVGLDKALRALGVRNAFEAGHLDFEPIGTDQKGGGLRLTNVFHAASVRVDESGCHAQLKTGKVAKTDADNAAKVQVATGDATSTTQEAVMVRFDRPFLYAIQHQLNGAFLLMGRVADPQP
jgi:serpin B